MDDYTRGKRDGWTEAAAYAPSLMLANERDRRYSLPATATDWVVVQEGNRHVRMRATPEGMRVIEARNSDGSISHLIDGQYVDAFEHLFDLPLTRRGE